MTLPKPTDTFEWATTAPNVVQPATGKQLAGWAEGELPPASFVNWLYQTVGLWLVYLTTLFRNHSTTYDTGPAQVGPELVLGPNGEVAVRVSQVDAANLDEAELRLVPSTVGSSGLRADRLRTDQLFLGLDTPNDHAAFTIDPSSPAGAGVTVGLDDVGAAQAALAVNSLVVRATPAAHIPRDAGLQAGNMVKAYCKLLVNRKNYLSEGGGFSQIGAYNVGTVTAPVAGAELWTISIPDRLAGTISGVVLATATPAPSSADPTPVVWVDAVYNAGAGRIEFYVYENTPLATPTTSGPLGSTSIETLAFVHFILF